MKSSRLTIQKQLLGVGVGSAILLAAACGNAKNSLMEPASNGQTSSVQPASAVQVAAAPVRTGQPAPDFTGVDSNGKTHQLSDFKGRVVVLEWTNHQCPFVRKHYESGNMQKLQKQATGKGVVWLSVNSSALGQQGYVNGGQANSLTKSRRAFPTAVLLDPDGKIGRLYSARTTPHMFVIAANGTLAYMGAIDSISSADKADVTKANNYVSTALDAVLQGRRVDTPATQPYGCTVKYKS